MNLFQRDRVNVAWIEPYVGEALRDACHLWKASLARVAFFTVFGAAVIFCYGFLDLAWSVNENGVSRYHGKAPSWDFTNLWVGARLALAGQIAVLFDVDAYRAAINRDVVTFLSNSEWSYPPPMLLVGAPFAYLPLHVAHVLWTIVTLALFTGVLRAVGGSGALCALMIMSPAAMFNMAFGQNGALTAALLIGGLVASDRRALLGGALVGLLIIKPHAAILAPACFLAARNYAAFFAAALFVCMIVPVSIAAFGMEAWTGFFPDHVAVDGFLSRGGLPVILSTKWHFGLSVRPISGRRSADRLCGSGDHCGSCDCYGVVDVAPSDARAIAARCSHRRADRSRHPLRICL